MFNFIDFYITETGTACHWLVLLFHFNCLCLIFGHWFQIHRMFPLSVWVGYLWIDDDVVIAYNFKVTWWVHFDFIWFEIV